MSFLTRIISSARKILLATVYDVKCIGLTSELSDTVGYCQWCGYHPTIDEVGLPFFGSPTTYNARCHFNSIFQGPRGPVFSTLRVISLLSVGERVRFP